MIVNTNETYGFVLDRMHRENHIISTVYCDHFLHKKLNQVLCVTVTFLNGDSYTISVNHSDATMYEAPPKNKRTIKNDVIDIGSYLSLKKVISLDYKYTDFMKDIINSFHDRKNVHELIPINLWSKICTEYNLEAIEFAKNTNLSLMVYEFYIRLVELLHKIENEGVAINPDLFYKYFGEDKRKFYGDSNIVYTEYNPYTITQRPSNRFGGINYSALNKKNGCRESFISRYPNGTLVMIDYEAFHIRLIAEFLGLSLPTGNSIHLEFAKLYFPNEPVITEELYAASKQKTFEILYGISSKTYGIRLFEEVKKFKNDIKNSGSLVLPSGINIEVTEDNVDKYFNYYIQNLEVYRTVPLIELVMKFLQHSNNHVVLYTYDSILIDMETYNETTIRNINWFMNPKGKFPTRTYIGKNYNELEEIKL